MEVGNISPPALTHRGMTTAQIHEFSPCKTAQLTKLVEQLEIKQAIQLGDDSQTNSLLSNEFSPCETAPRFNSLSSVKLI